MQKNRRFDTPFLVLSKKKPTNCNTKLQLARPIRRGNQSVGYGALHFLQYRFSQPFTFGDHSAFHGEGSKGWALFLVQLFRHVPESKQCCSVMAPSFKASAESVAFREAPSKMLFRQFLNVQFW